MSKTTLLAHVNRSIATFDNDPPDTDYQRGFLAALNTVKHAAETLTLHLIENEAACQIAEEAFRAGHDWAIDHVTKCCADEFSDLATDGWNAFEPSERMKDLTKGQEMELIEAAEHYACRLDDLSLAPNGHDFNAIMEILSGRDVPDPSEMNR